MSGSEHVRVERAGPVTTVVLDRPERRWRCCGAPAAHFCSGADLTAVGTERGNRVAPDGDGPMGSRRRRSARTGSRPRRCTSACSTALLHQESLDEEAALDDELRHGMVSLAADTLDGAARFAAGECRHGEF